MLHHVRCGGLISHSGGLDASGWVRVTSSRCRLIFDVAAAAVIIVAPEKVTISGHRNAKAGDTITLSCVSAISSPPAVITWFTRGRHLSGSTSNVMPSAQVMGVLLYSNLSDTHCHGEVLFLGLGLTHGERRSASL